MSKRKISKKEVKQLQEQVDYLRCVRDSLQAELKASNEHLKFVVTDWNTLCLTLYRLLAIRVDGKVSDEWVARDAKTSEVLARCKSMPEVFEIVLLLRLEEAWQRGSTMSHYDNPTSR